MNFLRTEFGKDENKKGVGAAEHVAAICIEMRFVAGERIYEV